MGKHRALLILCTVLLISIFSACAWDRRKPLSEPAFERDLPVQHAKIVIYLAEVVPEKPLPETIWDNVSGPSWDVAESKQIGFTQHYKPQFFAIPPALLPAVAQSGVALIDTRIVIPFGRIFSGVLEAALKKAKIDYRLCYDKKCISDAGTEPNQQLLLVQIKHFYVWEYPLNHISLYIDGLSSYSSQPGIVENYEFGWQILRYELGSVLSTHSHFIRQMDMVSNRFAEELVLDILENSIFLPRKTI
jgi:hypothetical protein